MEHNRDDDYYALRPVNRTRHQILWLVLFFVIVAIIWAYYATLDEVTVAEGRVIPSSQVQIIQSLEGGIIKKILVKEGQHVEKGTLMMVLDDTNYRTDLNELNIEIITLTLQLSRLRDEIDNKAFVPATNKDYELNDDLIARQRQLYESRQREYRSLEERKNYAEKELGMSEPLVAKGAVSDVEVLHLRQKVAEIQHKLDNFKSETLKEYRETQLALSKAKQRKIAVNEKIEQTQIRSPITGTITQLYVTTLGGVITPGMNIMELVPVNDSLIVEARVKPADIGFIEERQDAMVKISAFDYGIYGGLHGKVVHVSADTTKDEEGNHYYEVWVRTNKNYLRSPKTDKHLYIIPGMMATVDILTGRKSVLDYLLKPILRGVNTAMRER